MLYPLQSIRELEKGGHNTGVLFVLNGDTVEGLATALANLLDDVQVVKIVIVIDRHSFAVPVRGGELFGQVGSGCAEQRALWPDKGVEDTVHG